MPKLTLYHAAPSRSSIVHWMLEEVGEPYELHLMSLKKGENRAADYLKVNPMGKVPALRHGDVVVTEAAAICAYLADAFPQAKLNVPVGDPRRGPYLKWLFFGPSCVEPAMMDHMFPPPETVREYLSRGLARRIAALTKQAMGPGWRLRRPAAAAILCMGGSMRDSR
jgi:glutathione S-transferase